MIAFGPVPSRRLGYSLGINHIPPKHCSYSCIYCQVGRTTTLETLRRDFFSVEQILREVEKKIADSANLGQVIDYLTLVPDGEPTLDGNLKKIIEALKPFGIPIAVISNSSLIDHEDVQEALLQADWVSLKVDTVSEVEWRQIDRPYARLSLSTILTGILNFRRKYRGELVTETMLIAGINDNETSIDNLSAYLLELQPFKSYLSIPTRPPAEAWVRAPDTDSLQRILEVLSKKISFLDLLFEAESSDFISTGNIKDDILSITAVHPIREEALRSMVAQAGAGWSVVDDLLSSRKITCLHYRGENFYLHSYPISPEHKLSEKEKPL